METTGAARRLERRAAEYKQAVEESRIFYRRRLALVIARDVVSSAIAAGVSTQWAQPEIATYAGEIARLVTEFLEQLEARELNVH